MADTELPKLAEHSVLDQGPKSLDEEGMHLNPLKFRNVRIKIPDIFRDFADFLDDPTKVLGTEEKADSARLNILTNDPKNVNLMTIIRAIRSYVHSIAACGVEVWKSQIEEPEEGGSSDETIRSGPTQGRQDDGHEQGQDANAQS